MEDRRAAIAASFALACLVAATWARADAETLTAQTGVVNVESLAKLDLSGQALIRLTLDGSHVTGEERIDMKKRIRDLIQAPDGAVCCSSTATTANCCDSRPHSRSRRRNRSPDR